MMKWVFGADTTPFRKGLDNMRTQTKAFAGSMKGMLIGALGVTAIISGFKNLFQEMDRVQKLGLRFGESAETVQKISLAASLAGSSMEGLAKAMTVATRNSVEAAQNGGRMAEAFARLGINAGEFASMGMESKVLELAKNFNGSSASASQLADMIEILGKAGADMLPFLIQGQDELQRQFDETSTVSQSTVDSIANFNDAITELKQNAQVGGGVIVDAFRLILGGASIYIASLVTFVMDSFDMIVNSGKAVGDILTGVFSGDMKKAEQGIKRFQNTSMELGRDLKKNFEVTTQSAAEMYDEIYGDKKSDNKKPVDIESIKDALEVEEQRKKLADEITKLKEEAAMAELSLAEKILALEEKRAQLAADADQLSGNASLEAQKEMLEVEKELKKLREDQGKIQETADEKAKDLAKKAADEEKKKSEELAQLRKDEEKQIRDAKFEGLKTDEEKVAMLAEEQADLLKQSESATTEEDKIKLRMEARDKGSEIAGILGKEKENVLPTLATSSLASIGGGGSANVLSAGTQKIDRQISLLEVIARNTAKSEGGGPKIPDPI